MTKLEAIIKPFQLEPVKTALIKLGIEGMTVSQVRTYGREKGDTEIYRGSEYMTDFLPRIKIELVIADAQVEGATAVIMKESKTGKIASGTIFSSPVDEVVRIRTGEAGAKAL